MRISTLILWFVFGVSSIVDGQNGEKTNLPPKFLPGGDMSGFSIAENTPPGTSIYKLQGVDPEGSRLAYSISGDYLSVQRNTGIVTLIRPLDRETQNFLEAIISLTDEKGPNAEPNTVSLRREIPVLDSNDNAPLFIGKPFRANVSEAAAVGNVFFTGIKITDADEGRNAEIILTCDEKESPLACEHFQIKAERIGTGDFVGVVSTKAVLDYDNGAPKQYVMVVRAEDAANPPEPHLSTTATIYVDVEDVPDEKPIFESGPYVQFVPENSPSGTKVLSVRVMDGDMGNLRNLKLSLIEDDKGYFKIENVEENNGVFVANIVTSEVTLDREDRNILAQGERYSFKIKAVELDSEGKETSDFSTADVTILVTDVNDYPPEFDKSHYTVTIPENIKNGHAIPGLDMLVKDNDTAMHARFELSLEEASNAEDIFAVYPTSGLGQAPITIRVKNSSKLDYEDLDMREMIVRIIATQDNDFSSTATVTIILSDANDNPPVFPSPSFFYTVSESAQPNSLITRLEATDADSGSFGEIRYSLRGFGVEKFFVNESTGDLFVADCGIETCLDYETQTSYSLIYVAKDGGGLMTNVVVTLDIKDVNDNAPEFEKSEYRLVISNGATALDPPLQVQARDKDGDKTHRGNVSYQIEASDAPDGLFTMDADTGILAINRPINVSETKSNRYNLTIVGTDSGSPTLSSETQIILIVGFDGNEAPSFAQSIYQGVISEDSAPGTTVIQVEASDPDGSNLELRYFLVGSVKDNFSIHNRTGIITVAPDARLRWEKGGKEHKLIVHAVDSGKPHPQTATATVFVQVEDVNNENPQFVQDLYVHHVAEITAVQQEVFAVTATDPDTQADLRYALSGPYTIWDKSGFSHEELQMRFFTINETTGMVKLVEALNHHLAASMDFRVQVTDANATEKFPNQTAITDVTVYVQAHNDHAPVFNSPWSPAHPVLKSEANEEQETGTIILGLRAHNHVTGYLSSKYQLISEPDNITLEYIELNPLTGEVAFKKPIDFETLQNKTLEFQVEATLGDHSSIVILQLTILDVNDNKPEFSQTEYRQKILESVRYPEPLFTVSATDKDSGQYGEIRYHLTGNLSDLFQINATTGVVTVAPNKTLDREEQDQYSFSVVAKDHPTGGDERKHAMASIIIELLDVNDNAPVFTLPSYSAVVPENAPLDLSVTKLIATDLDEGAGGQVEYLLMHEDKLKEGSFSIVNTTGEVRVNQPLTGKGRAEPYKLVVRAQNVGDPWLYTDIDLVLYIGDMTANDGIPTFTKAALEEQAIILEDAPVGSSIFQVSATDPDDASTPNGRITYKFLDDGILGVDHAAFDINSVTGLITNKVKLDRETKASYSLILVAQDQGNPVQQATRVLTVTLKDVDDHSPKFSRTQHDGPLQFSVLEEAPPGWEVDTLKAVDLDEAQNAQIEYLITYGDDAGLFSLERMTDNSARLLVKGRIDHEQHDSFLLTVKCFKPSEKPSELRKIYNPQDPSEIQVRVWVKDTDDNSPKFRQWNITTGVRLNAPLFTEVVRLDAFDVDSDSPPIVYKLLNVSFVRAEQVGFTFSEANIDTSDTINKAFALDSSSGSLTTLITYGHFVGGYFLLHILASNGEGTTSRNTTTVTVYVLRDTELLKFVFNKTPSEVRNALPSFRQDMEKALEVPLSLNLYESQFYSAEKGHVDFTSTSSCFQIVGKDHVFDSKATELLLNRVKNPSLNGVFDKYKVVNVERCVQRGALYEINNVEIWLLIIGVLVGIAAFVATIAVCCFFKKYKQRRKKVTRMPIVESPPIHTFVAGTLPPGSVISAPIVDNRTYEWQETAIPVDRPISRVSSAHQSLYYS